MYEDEQRPGDMIRERSDRDSGAPGAFTESRGEAHGKAPEQTPVQPPESAQQPSAATQAPSAAAGSRPRRGLRLAIAAVALLALGAGAYYGHYWWTTGSYLVSTDDAYVGAKSATL